MSTPMWNNIKAVRYLSMPPPLPTIDSPIDFRVVKLGDLNLLDEMGKQNVVEWHPIRHKRTGVVVRHIKVVVGTRRVYRARIFGSQDPMTVVIYNDPQFEWASHHPIYNCSLTYSSVIEKD
jgi:hypothetical protein